MRLRVCYFLFPCIGQFNPKHLLITKRNCFCDNLFWIKITQLCMSHTQIHCCGCACFDKTLVVHKYSGNQHNGYCVQSLTNQMPHFYFFLYIFFLGGVGSKFGFTKGNVSIVKKNPTTLGKFVLLQIIYEWITVSFVLYFSWKCFFLCDSAGNSFLNRWFHVRPNKLVVQSSRFQNPITFMKIW